MFRTNSQSFSLSQLLQNFFQIQSDRKLTQSKLAEAKTNPHGKNQNLLAGGKFFDYSPSGTYVKTRDSLIISTEAYAVLKEIRYLEIDKMLERGDSLSAKGVSYEEYNDYSFSRVNVGHDKDIYNFLCYEGKNRAYFENQAKDVYNRWAKGEDVSERELAKWTQYAVGYQTVARYQREINQGASLLSDALQKNGIVLGDDQKIELRLNSRGKYEVGGIDDPDEKRAIEEIVNNTIDGFLLKNYLNIPGYEKETTWYKKTSDAYNISTDIRTAEKFLEKNGGSLKDLSIDWNGKISGNLPKDVLEKLNSVEYSFGDSLENWELFIVKTSIQKSIGTLKKYGDYDKMPKIDYYFSFSNGKLNLVDKQNGNIIPDAMK